MAVLDGRLLDLIETLIAARMDWLAFELMEGIKAGRQSMESTEMLADARRNVHSQEHPIPKGVPEVRREPSIPIEGNEQVEWAARYIADRLDATMAELSAAIDNLDAIEGLNSDRANPPEKPKPGGPLLIVLDDEKPRKADREGIAIALDVLPKLRSRLSEWSYQVRGQVQI